MKKIGQSAFESCSSLTSITMPDSITSVGEDAFYCCSSLKDVVLSKNIKVINRYTFSNCSALETIDIPENVLTISQAAFSYDKNLKMINVLGSKTKMDQNSIGTGYWYVDDDGNLEGCGQLVIRCPKASTTYENYVEFFEDIENVTVEIVE